MLWVEGCAFQDAQVVADTEVWDAALVVVTGQLGELRIELAVDASVGAATRSPRAAPFSLTEPVGVRPD